MTATNILADLKAQRDREAAELATLEREIQGYHATLLTAAARRDVLAAVVETLDGVIAKLAGVDTAPQPETPRAAPGQVRAAVLNALVSAGGTLTVANLSEFTGYDGPAVTRACVALVEAGEAQRVKRGSYQRPAQAATVEEIGAAVRAAEGREAAE